MMSNSGFFYTDLYYRVELYLKRLLHKKWWANFFIEIRDCRRPTIGSTLTLNKTFHYKLLPRLLVPGFMVSVFSTKNLYKYFGRFLVYVDIINLQLTKKSLQIIFTLKIFCWADVFWWAEYQGLNKHCIPWSYVCDSVMDCPSGTDESISNHKICDLSMFCQCIPYWTKRLKCGCRT